MATLSQLQNALTNPNVRKMLDLISASEGTTQNGYATAFGGGRLSNLAAHPNTQSQFTQTDGKTNTTTAAGRYQFLNSTWQGLANRYGFKSFSPEEQDLGAIALIAGRGALNDVMKGDYKTAINKLGKEWASLPSSQYAQGKRSWDFVSKHLGQDVGGGFEPELVPKSMMGKAQNSYTPEEVPKDMLTQNQASWHPEEVPREMMQNYQPETAPQESMQASQFEPELVPDHMLN